MYPCKIKSMSEENRSGSEIVVYITASNEDEAATIARALVEAKLAACVNIIKNVRSIYVWQGKLQDDSEALLIVKTRKGHFDSLSAEVRKIHSYEVPEIIALPVTQGSEEYLRWIRESTEKKYQQEV
jgi:periplasmic divalent cation tolerance protein